MATSIQKTFTPNSKDVRYINRDFSQLREALINFSKTYFPNSYKDFSDASPGMMFIEQAAYVGDILSYYTDYSFKEGMIQNATERKNIIALAKYLGYRVQPIQASSGELDIFQLCPAKLQDDGSYAPDQDYALIIKENMQVSNNLGLYYIVNQNIDFSVSTSLSPRTDLIYSRNPDGTPQFFLLKKTGTISAGQVVSKTFVVNDPQQFLRIYLDEDNVLGVLNVTDSDNNTWHEVDYLAQETILTSVPNDFTHEGVLDDFRDSVPYILKYLRTSRRFTTNVDENNKTYLEFGAGLEGFSDEFVNISSKTVGVGLSNISNLNVPLDPTNFLKNSTYGISPSNTTLTISYLIGGGISSNSLSNDIRNVVSVEFDNPVDGFPPEKVQLLTTVKNSLQVNNPNPCTGGKDGQTNDEIKISAVANIAAQTRAVTREDYLVRIYSMPPKFGSIAKAQIVTDNSLQINVKKILSGVVTPDNKTSLINTSINNYFRNITFDVSNPFAINVYLLCYDSNKNLVPANGALITNLINYLRQFRMLTDGINIIDGYVINVGVNFTITVFRGFNKKEVLLNCINAAKNFFNIDNWEFSQPINLSQLQLEIAKVDGVQSVVSLDIVNKTVLDGNYSPIEYDINSATKNNIIYPSLDPSIFEVKYPDSDIRGTSL